MRPKIAAGLILGAIAVALVAAFWWHFKRLPSAPRFVSMELAELRLWARADQVDLLADDELGVVTDDVEIWLESPSQLGPVAFRIDGRPGTIRVGSAGARQDHLPPAAEDDSRFFFEWSPEKARQAKDRPGYWYRLTVSFPDRPVAPEPDVRLAFVGTRAWLDRDLYHVDWLGCASPQAVAAGEPFLVLAHARNASEHLWPDQSHAGVRLAGRWPGGAATRLRLGTEVAPGDEIERWLEVSAPTAPGRYKLDVDLYFEPVAWFSERGATTCLVDVEVR